MKFKVILCSIAAACLMSRGYALNETVITATTVLETSTTYIGQPIKYPKTKKPVVTMAVIEIPPGTETGPHLHPNPLFAYVMEGTLTIEVKGHGEFVFEEGEGIPEVAHTIHNGKNLGDKTVKLLVVFIGQEGKPNTINVN